VADVTDTELIKAAAAALNSQSVGNFYVADVGCALRTFDNQIFVGSSIGGYLGVCAEQSAVSNLVANCEPRIKKLVAVWKNEQGRLHALPPCGRCREFLRLLSPDNLETDIILGKDHIVKLRTLLPFYGWHAEEL
jgi:cytidine deaminase